MKRKAAIIIWMIFGVLLALGPVWGILGTIGGMLEAFGHLAREKTEVEALAGNISFALRTTIAGWVACPIGIIIITVSAIRFGHIRNESKGSVRPSS